MKYKGIIMQQMKTALPVFDEFLNEVEFEYVVEIGTAYGGLTQFLFEHSLVHGWDLISYDITDKYLDRSFQNGLDYLFNFKIGNCFDEKIKEEIIDILENNVCLLLCDGGQKHREFNTFGKYLTKGSYIMAHDYSPDRKYFDEVRNKPLKDGGWNWFEIADIADQQLTKRFKQKEDLKFEEVGIFKSPYWYQKFLDVAWLAAIKE